MTLKQMYPAGKLPAKFSRCVQPSLPGICPDCGGETFIDTDCEVIVQGNDERELERRSAKVVFCSGCEYAKEIE